MNPSFEPSKIPFYTNKISNTYIIQEAGQRILCSIVSIGNPHCIIQVDDIENAAVDTLGKILEKHTNFPDHANIGFMQIVKHEYIRLRVYERGIGETQACGSGACAAAAVGIIQGLLTENIMVELPGGQLHVSWKGPGYPLYLTGSATFVYDGFLYL